MHTGMPLWVFVDTRDCSALRCWQRRFVGVHSVHSPRETRVAREAVTQDIATVKAWMGIRDSDAQSGLVTWILDLDTHINFCCVSSPLLFSLNYKPFHPAEWRTITGCFFFFFSFFPPFISIWGTMRCSCPPACCEMWQQGPFSEKLAAISAIMLIFTCVPCRTEFSLCTETPPGNCCKTKTHQSTKALNERLNRR